MLVLDLAHLTLGHAAVGRPDVIVQVRDKGASAREILEGTRDLVARGARTVVNDRVDLAIAAGAEGVHLPEEGLTVEVARALLGAGADIGVSLHVGSRFEEHARGADWALFGPVWETPGKGASAGLPALAEAVRRCPCPVLAIGGVDRTRVAAVIGAGAAGVAVIRAAHDLAALLAAAGT
jgi:thiamine-phosphate pyrophosphorylase